MKLTVPSEADIASLAGLSEVFAPGLENNSNFAPASPVVVPVIVFLNEKLYKIGEFGTVNEPEAVLPIVVPEELTTTSHIVFIA